MRSIALILALVSAAFAARANDVDDGTARVTALEQRVRALGADRRALAAAYDAKTAEVARLKAQPSAWGRDRKLQALLAESQDMAGALDRKDGDVRAAGAALDRAKEALIGSVDAELGADPAPAPERAAALHELRRRLAADLVKPMHLADERIEPGDDAEDLELKAGALAQNETALAAELDRLKARAAYFRRQAKLTKSRARADEQDVFREEEARVPGRPNTASSRPANDSAAPPNPALPPGGPVQIGSNPASLARSAERATRELAERAEKLHLHRLEMLERAKKLRGGP